MVDPDSRFKNRAAKKTIKNSTWSHWYIGVGGLTEKGDEMKSLKKDVCLMCCV